MHGRNRRRLRRVRRLPRHRLRRTALRRRPHLQRRRVPETVRRRRLRLRARAARHPEREGHHPRRHRHHRLRAGRRRGRLPHLSRARRDRLVDRRGRRGRREERHLPLRRRPRLPRPRGRSGRAVRVLDHRVRQHAPRLHAHRSGVHAGLRVPDPGRRSGSRLPHRQPERRRRLHERGLGGAALQRGKLGRIPHRSRPARGAARAGLARRRRRLLHGAGLDHDGYEDGVPHPLRGRRRLAGEQRRVLLHRGPRVRHAVQAGRQGRSPIWARASRSSPRRRRARCRCGG